MILRGKTVGFQKLNFSEEKVDTIYNNKDYCQRIAEL